MLDSKQDFIQIILERLKTNKISIKPTQLFIESPENLIPLEEESFNLENLYSSLIQ
jgi:hypothetical protein